ncbi:MAG: (d)CMP kinase [Candidatus Omnitrophota bacterium]
MIIAIDGPAGAGKSTVAKILAKKLGFLYIDTGAMYRALTLKALETDTDIANTEKMGLLAEGANIDLRNDPDGTLNVFLDGKDVTADIRVPRITKFVSDVAKIKWVRQVMVKLQRELGQRGNSVLDGRDIGTVVFPDAQVKFYIDASSSERVNRRYKEMLTLGQKIVIQDVEKDLTNRDTIDSTRECSPLKQAVDAVYVDTTNLTIEEVVEVMLKHINQNG